MRKERLENLSLDVRGGSKRQVLGRASFVRWFDIHEFTKILWFIRMKEIMCDGD